VVTYVEDMQLK